jgi:hypothetical protein
LLSLLLGAGVLGGLAVSALAGDKIEFSPVGESLAMPKVDRPESEPAEALARFSFENRTPEAGIPYPLMPPPAAAPSRRRNSNDPNLRNGNGGLGLGPERLTPNETFDPSYRETYATNSSSNQASNYLSAAKAWETSDNPDDLGRSTDKTDSRYGRADARSKSLTPAERRELENKPGFGSAGDKTLGSRTDEANSFGAKTPLADLLKQRQNRSLAGTKPSLFKQLFQSADSKDSSGLEPPSILPSDSPLVSPLERQEPGYNGYNDTSARALFSTPGRSFGNADQGNASGLPAMRAWSSIPGFGSQAAEPAPPPRPPPPQAAGQRQQGGMALPWPKQRNSVFNNN